MVRFILTNVIRKVGDISEIAVKIIPYLVGLLVAISLLRNSGAFEFVMDG